MPLMTAGQGEVSEQDLDEEFVADLKGVAVLGEPIVGVELVTLDANGPGALAAHALASPNEPTPAAMAAHNLTHATYEDWCPVLRVLSEAECSPSISTPR